MTAPYTPHRLVVCDFHHHHLFLERGPDPWGVKSKLYFCDKCWSRVSYLSTSLLCNQPHNNTHRFVRMRLYTCTLAYMCVRALPRLDLDNTRDT